MKIAYQGIEGSYSESCAKAMYPNCKTISCKTFDDVFKKANENEDVNAIIPESNKTTGNIGVEYLIFKYRLNIYKEKFYSIDHHLLALPGAPVYESGLYKVVYDKWIHPNGKEVKIPDYFVPNDPKIAYAMEHFDVEAQKELDKVVKRMKWGKKKPPKRVIAIAAICCLPRLLGRNDLSPKYYKLLDDVLAGKYRGKEYSYPLEMQGIDKELQLKEKNLSDVLIDTRV